MAIYFLENGNPVRIAIRPEGEVTVLASRMFGGNLTDFRAVAPSVPEEPSTLSWLVPALRDTIYCCIIRLERRTDLPIAGHRLIRSVTQSGDEGQAFHLSSRGGNPEGLTQFETVTDRVLLYSGSIILR